MLDLDSIRARADKATNSETQKPIVQTRVLCDGNHDPLVADLRAKLAAAEREREDARRLLGELEVRVEKDEIVFSHLEAERDQLKRERDAAQGEAAALRKALEEQIELWEMASYFLNRSDAANCRVSFMGVHDPIGKLAAALATPSTAGERWKAVDRVIRAAQFLRDDGLLQIGDPLYKALDELAVLEKGE